MNTKQSYLDSINAGRPRKAHVSLEELNRSLENLEGCRRQADVNTTPGENRDGDRNRASVLNYLQMVRDIDRVRNQEEGIASAGRIATELKGLREELRHQMAASLRREFVTLRKDIERAYAASPATSNSAALGAEFERLSEAIHSLAERSDDRAISMLRLALGSMKKLLDSLTREESVYSVERREEVDRREFHIENRPSDISGHKDDPILATLNRRLHRIAEAVNKLPDSACLRSLEEKVRVLASTVDNFVGQQDRRDNQTFAHIEERLDEISRAIVAATAMIEAPHFDPAPFEAIETRIASLARQVEELIEDRSSIEIMDRLSHLSQRVDQIATNSVLPEKSLNELTRQVSAIAEKMDRSSSGPDHILRGIDDRFATMADILDRRQGDAVEHGQALFRGLERRLEDVAARFDDPGVMEAIDARLAELAQRLETNRPSPGEEVMRHMEARLEDISARLESSAAHFAAIDPTLIRSLETQISSLSEHLARPATPLPDFEDIAPRLDEIEQSIANQRATILEATRDAAEKAVQALGENSRDAVAVAGLADDLKSLEMLTRRSDDRNTRIFEAIHDTLLKIVERLGALEHPALLTATETAESGKMAVDAAPPIQPESFPPLPAEPDLGNDDLRTPAVATTVSAMRTNTAEDPASTSRVRSMLGTLSRAFSGHGKAEIVPEVEAVPEPQAPTIDLDEPITPYIANQPLEPGSGAPDLSAIMRRVRDERGQTQRPTDKEVAKSDFIAAARRAAHAATADAGSMDTPCPSDQHSSSRFGEFLRRRRKAMLMGTVAVALAMGAAQVGKIYFDDEKHFAADDTFADQQPPATAEIAKEEEDLSQNVDASMATSSITRSNLVDALSHDAIPATLREAAKAGDPKAMFEIAARYAEGRGIKNDVTAAAQWYERSAELGFAQAQYRIASIYENGRGVARDIAKARTWYQMAAAQGNASAMHNLAVMLAMGPDGVVDNESAARWFTEAAELGVKDSQFNLGILAAKGIGMKQNLEESYKWFALVAKTGDQDAAAKRDDVAKLLRSEQLEHARATVEIWKPKAVNAATNAIDIPASWQEEPAKTAVAAFQKGNRADSTGQAEKQDMH